MKKIISNEIDLLFTFYKNQEEEYKQPSKYIYEMCNVDDRLLLPLEINRNQIIHFKINT